VLWRRFAGTRRAILLSPSRTPIRWRQQEESWLQERTRSSELYISEIVAIFIKVRWWGTPFLRRVCPPFGGGIHRGAKRRGRELAVLNGIGPESVSQATSSNCVPAIAFRPVCSISSGVSPRLRCQGHPQVDLTRDDLSLKRSLWRLLDSRQSLVQTGNVGTEILAVRPQTCVRAARQERVVSSVAAVVVGEAAVTRVLREPVAGRPR
jgi:hypothetical protein